MSRTYVFLTRNSKIPNRYYDAKSSDDSSYRLVSRVPVESSRACNNKNLCVFAARKREPPRAAASPKTKYKSRLRGFITRASDVRVACQRRDEISAHGSARDNVRGEIHFVETLESRVLVARARSCRIEAACALERGERGSRALCSALSGDSLYGPIPRQLIFVLLSRFRCFLHATYTADRTAACVYPRANAPVPGCRLLREISGARTRDYLQVA